MDQGLENLTGLRSLVEQVKYIRKKADEENRDLTLEECDRVNEMLDEIEQIKKERSGFIEWFQIGVKHAGYV